MSPDLHKLFYVSLSLYIIKEKKISQIPRNTNNICFTSYVDLILKLFKMKSMYIHVIYTYIRYERRRTLFGGMKRVSGKGITHGSGLDYE